MLSKNAIAQTTSSSSSGWSWTNPWDIIWGLEEKQERCRLDLGGGWFTSSVEIACKTIECPIPMLCECTPIPCGQI